MRAPSCRPPSATSPLLTCLPAPGTAAERLDAGGGGGREEKKKELTVVISEEERDSGGPIDVDHDRAGLKEDGLTWAKGKMKAGIDPREGLSKGASITLQLESPAERAERRARLAEEACRMYNKATGVSDRQVPQVPLPPCLPPAQACERAVHPLNKCRCRGIIRIWPRCMKPPTRRRSARPSRSTSEREGERRRWACSAGEPSRRTSC